MSKPHYTPDGRRYDDFVHSDVSLKPMLQNQAPLYSPGSNTSNDAYKPVASYHVHDQEINESSADDQRLKQRIRVLRLVSRIIALVLSLATLAPLAMTLAKFLSTKNETFNVNGQERTAWAKDSITWYTYMYFGISLISFVFNLAIVIAYWRGIKKANKVASIASWWTNTVLVGHVVVWIVSVAIYRYGKEPVDGKFRDLWGWTCSPVAQKIQKDIPNVDFNRYCTVQAASFYSGPINAVAGILSALILVLVALRAWSKKRNQKKSPNSQTNFEPLRS